MEKRAISASVDEALARLDRVAADTNRKEGYRAPKEYFEAVEDHESLNEESSFPGSTNLSNRLASYWAPHQEPARSQLRPHRPCTVRGSTR